MKKFLAVITAICVMLTASITAFAQAQPKSEDVQKEIDSIVRYITSQKEGNYTIDDAVDFYYLVKSTSDLLGNLSNADLEKYYTPFVDSVRENVKANNGKLITQYGESLATYAAVINTLNLIGEDPWEFEGYDLTAAFGAMPADSEINPYFYNIVIPSLSYCDNEQFCEDVCKNFVDKYYTMGSGMENWGYSCDNTAYFVSAITYAYGDYDAELNDAIKVIETYKTEGGYFCDSQWGTNLNANSTGLALMAYAEYEWYTSIFEDTITLDKSNEIYSQLAAFKTSTEGAYSYEVGGEPNLYASFDVLRGLISYNSVLQIKEVLDEWEEDPTDPDDPTKEEEATKPTVPTTKFEIKPLVPSAKDAATTTTAAATKKNTSKKSPSTGAGAMTIAFSIALAGAGAAVLSAKKKEQ